MPKSDPEHVLKTEPDKASKSEKTERAKNKRKTPASESCIRIDLFELCPNAEKAKAIDHLLENYRKPSCRS